MARRQAPSAFPRQVTTQAIPSPSPTPPKPPSDRHSTCRDLRRCCSSTSLETPGSLIRVLFAYRGTCTGILDVGHKFPSPPIRLSRALFPPIPGSRPFLLGVGLSQANARPGVVVKQFSRRPDKSWLSLAESDGPVAMLFLEFNAESSPTTAAVLHTTTSCKITSDLQGNSTREIKGDTG